jgi:arabinogalactan oligomer/maltooligosaccharide transport system permease protein
MTTASISRPQLNTSNVIAMIWAVLVFILSLGLLGFGLYLGITSFRVSDPTQFYPRLVLGIVALVGGVVILRRYTLLLSAIFRESDYQRAQETMRLDLIQLFLLLVLVVVLFPVVWILSMSLDPRDFSRPTGLTIIPPGATFEAYLQVLTRPSPNPVSFLQLLRNSLLVSGGTAFGAVVIGTSAAYAFSRLKFPGRQVGMLGFVLVLMIPPGGTLAPLFVLLNSIRINDFNLRTSLWGLAIAFTSTALPFAIWNMKGFIDALPYDLEEAAQIDGCTRTQGFIRVILPLAVPGMAVTALWGFLTGWSEFILSWTFLTDPATFTLPMVLRGMVGEYAAGTPWAQFAAMAILMSIPPMVIFFILQRYLVSGLAVGGVKG